MPRVSRLFLAATLSTLAALLPVTAFAAGSLTAYVVGAEYAFGHPCIGGTSTGTTVVGTTASFAGYGSAPPGGRANALFNTTICHTDLTRPPVLILSGGSFTLATSSLLLRGTFAGGFVLPGQLSPPGSCNEVFPVTADFAASGKITGGSAKGFLTHYGVRIDGVCHAYAATITGTATLLYR